MSVNLNPYNQLKGELLKVTNLSFDEMVSAFIDAFNSVDYSRHEDSIGWLFPDDGMDTWEFLEYTEETQVSQFTRRVKNIVKDKQISNLYNNIGLANETVNGMYYLSKLEIIAEQVINNTKWEVESDDNTLRVRFYEYVPSRPDMKHWLFLSYDGEEERYGSVATHYRVEQHKNKLTAGASIRDESRTRRQCPECRSVCNPNTEMFTVERISRHGSQRPHKVCVLCTTYFHDFYDLATGRFRFVGSEVEVEEFDNQDIRTQDRRNLARFDLFDWISDKVGTLPFLPNVRHEDYSYELNWSYWTTNTNGDVVAIPSDRYGNSIQRDRAHESKEYAKQGMPLGMELEVQYRMTDRNLSQGIATFLNPLHKDFPYGNERLRTQNNQLAVGTYDTSTGRHGMEFKFQPMSWEFLKGLPDDFFTALQENFRGYHAKRCGIHMNIPKSVLSSGQYWFFIAFHNMALFNFEHSLEDEDTNLLGDIYQRVDVDYAKWMYLTDPTFTTQSNACCEAHPVEEVTNQQRIACATAKYLARYSHSPQRNCWINIDNPGRLEVRAFSSATMKDRLIKNFQFMEALLLYSDAVTYNYRSTDAGNGVQGNIITAWNSLDDYLMACRMLDEDMFLRWYVMTGLDNKYTELTDFLHRTNHLDRITAPINGDLNDYLRTAVNYT